MVRYEWKRSSSVRFSYSVEGVKKITMLVATFAIFFKLLKTNYISLLFVYFKNRILD